MKKQGTGNSEQGTEALAKLLRRAIPPVGNEADPAHDLWPAMERRLRVEAVAPAPGKVRVPWFDWALAGGLAALLAMFPAWIPVLLYYL